MAGASLLRFSYCPDRRISIHLERNPLGRIESGVNLFLTSPGTANVSSHPTKDILQAKTSRKLGLMLGERQILGLAWLLFLLHG
jgi:hypothetical protein